MCKKKILYIHKDDISGGSAQSLFLLLKNIKDIHNISIVLCQRGPFHNKLKKLKIPVYFVPFKNWRQLKYIFKNIYAVFKLKKIIKILKPDIIHCNSYEVNPLMTLAAHKKVNKICHVRDMITPQKAKKFLLHKADIIIVISKAVKKQIHSVHPHIKVIYNGVDVAQAYKTQNKLNQYFKLNKKTFKVGIIGNCEERKRQEDFIRAGLLLCSLNEDRKGFRPVPCNDNKIKTRIPSLSNKRKKFLFFIIGNNKSHYGEKIKNMARKYRNIFFFINYVDNIYSIIKGLDIIVITSKEEAFGRTAIEAMICKKSVIGTNTGGIPEIIQNEKTGLLFGVGDYEKLAEHILFLQTHKKYQKKYSLNGYNRTLKLFTLKNHIKQIEALYKNL